MHTIKAYGAGEVQGHSFLTLALDGQVHARERASSTDHTGHGLVPQSWSGHFEKHKNFLPLLGIEPQFLRQPACSSVTTMTTLFQLLYYVCIFQKDCRYIWCKMYKRCTCGSSLMQTPCLCHQLFLLYSFM